MNFFNGACELKRKLQTALFAAVLLSYSGLPANVLAQEHPPAATAAAEHVQPDGEHAAEGGHDQSIGGMIRGMAWPVANFIIFLGVLYYYLNKPFKEHLAGRSSAIRKDLVDAAELRANANAQLAAIDQKLQALPRELDALRRRGAGEIESEEHRIALAAAADRDRMLEQTRREIELQVRLAKKEILEHAADLSVQLATERIKKDVTPADQDRLVDRYLSQVKENT
jgi:F-type H+-transporting ATPase subunit b